ncbi:MAG: hypothetical protein Ct9H300mP12_14530 [Acidimicrobiales bacterium]|nr:MAG: hypothetical protein Ct9H300mP12_14530 [Acidimicrobiales bacterium]
MKKRMRLGRRSSRTEEAAPAEALVVCELAYYTGEFGSYGPFLTAGLTFPSTT